MSQLLTRRSALALVASGDGPTDFNALVEALAASGYRGPVEVEVSVDVYDQPGYDPFYAAGSGSV